MGRRVNPETIEAVKRATEMARQRALIAVVRELSEAAPEAAASLRHLAVQAEDERARYSAAAKILDFLAPKQQSPLVMINLEGNFKSHLGLPPAPAVQPIDVTAEQVQGRTAVQIIKAELERRAKIDPEAVRHRDYMRQRFGVTEIVLSPEAEKFEAIKPPEPQKLELKPEIPTPPATAWPESK